MIPEGDDIMFAVMNGNTTIWYQVFAGTSIPKFTK
jgi:hypothetical protein